MRTRVSYTLSISTAGMAAPPVVVKSSEVAADVEATVRAEGAVSLPAWVVSTTAVWPAEHADSVPTAAAMARLPSALLARNLLIESRVAGGYSCRETYAKFPGVGITSRGDTPPRTLFIASFMRSAR